MTNIGIKDLAEVAGVSIATASRAISNPNRVSKATRDKVVEAAKEIGYTPNRLGASLRTSKTGNIIVIIPDVSDTFNFGAVKSLEKSATKHGYSVLLGDTQGLRERELAYGDMVKSKQADGIILFAYRLPFDLRAENTHFELPPIVNSCERVENNGIPFVSIDNHLAAQQATEHLIQLGHKNIAVITGDINTPSTQSRLAGYRDAMKAANIATEESYVQHGTYSLNMGEACTEKLLLLKQRPSAIFCFSDEIALGCLHSLKKQGFDVPNDISVIGFDDIRFAKYMSPPLTTIAQPVEEIGAQCVDLLIDIIEGNDTTRSEVILPHKLIVRESTGPCKK